MCLVGGGASGSDGGHGNGCHMLIPDPLCISTKLRSRSLFLCQ